MKKKRTTIGFLVDYTDNEYQFPILRGIIDCAEKYDVNLICFEGGIYNNNSDLERNAIYDLIDPERVDGLIILADAIANRLDQRGLYSFCSRFHPIPIVLIGRALKQYPAVNINTTYGIREMLVHLIEHHGKRKFAFIKGHKGSIEAAKRFDEFIRMLDFYSLPVDESVFFEGDFLPASGIAAADAIIHNKKDVEVVLAANDEMAIGAINQFKKYGVRIPQDIAVVGIDDIDKASSMDPLLTTIRQPLHMEGWTAFEILLGMRERKNVMLNSILIIRESCGCSTFNPIELVLSDKAVAVSPGGGKITSIRKASIVKKIIVVMRNAFYDTTRLDANEWANKMVDSFVRSLSSGNSTEFVNVWKVFLDSLFNLNREIVLVKQIISVLFNEASSIIGLQYAEQSDLENMCNIILKSVNTMAILEERKINHQMRLEMWAINNVNDVLKIDVPEDKIFDVLYDKLMDFGIKASYLSLFGTDTNSDKSHPTLMMAYDGEKRFLLPPEGLTFDAKKLIPDGVFPSYRRHSLIIEYVNYNQYPIGFILFDIGNNINSIFGTLRRIIANLLHGAGLLKQIKNQKNDLVENLNVMRMTMAGFIQTLSLTIETRDPYTAGHQRRVSDLARSIATAMDLPRDMIEGIRMSAIVHDLGKIFIPAEILNKPGTLMDIEFSLIKHHPVAGYNVLKNINFPWPIADIVHQHHERLDGSGYPCGLKQDEIMIQAQIIAVADVVEAITSIRPYRPALGIDVALDEITKFSGTRYNEAIVKICIDLFNNGYAFK